MVVYYLEDTKPVSQMPRRQQFDLLRTRLTSVEFNTVEVYINGLVADEDISTSSWLPRSSDWNGTPLQPIYEKAARRNYDLAAQLFGLMVFYTFMNRPDEWITGRFEKDGIPLSGRTYFRKRY